MSGERLRRLERITEVFDRAGVAVGLLEADGSLIYCNAAWKEFHGLEPGRDYTGAKEDEVILRPDLRPGIDEFKRRLEPGSRFMTTIGLGDDGRERNFMVTAEHLVVVDPPAVLVLIWDVTELDFARSRLRAFRDRFEMQARTLFRAVPVPTFTWRRDGDVFRLEDFNDAGLRMTEGVIAGLVGRTDREVHADRPDIQADLRRCCDSRKTIERRMVYKARSGETWHLDVKYVPVQPDLVMVHTENITARVLAEEELERHRAGLEALVRDRTRQLEQTVAELRREAEDHDRAKQILAASESRYRAVTEMMSDYVFVAVLRPGGVLEREWIAGAYERITGYSLTELDAKLAALDVVHPDDRAALRASLRDISGAVGFELEFRLVTKSGDVRWVRGSAQLLPPSSEGLPRGLIAVKDIDASKQAEIKLARRNRELALVKRIRDIFDLETEQPRILEQAFEALRQGAAPPAAGLFVPDDERGVLVLALVRGAPGAFADLSGISLADPGLAAMAEENRVAFFGADSPFGAEPPGNEAGGGCFTAAFPVSVDGRLIAVFVFRYDGEYAIDPGLRRFFEIARDQLVLQFERLELHSERLKHEQQLRKLTNRLIEALEQERNMIALKLHDELGQTIVALNAEIHLLETGLDSCDDATRKAFAEIRHQLRELTQSTRELSYSLHPAMLDDLGLVPTLQWYIDKYVRSGELTVEFETAGVEERLTGEIALMLYRVAQEALTNVVKHADARAVSVKLIRGYPDLIMVIEDDGKGFDLRKTPAHGRGLGIVGMRERVERMRGRFRIAAAPGRGTRIRVTLPMEVDDDQNEGAARR